MGFVKEIGFDEIIRRGERAAAELPDELVYAGFSLGVLPAQKLAQTRPGARRALLFYSCVPTSEKHYFADSSLPSYDPDATELLTGRVLEFLAAH